MSPWTAARRIVCLFGDGLYADDYSEVDWGYLKFGALVTFEKFGLIHYESELETGLTLARR